jgi:hypothetical protein
VVKTYTRDLSEMGRPISLAALAAGAWRRARQASSPRCPYRIGDAVIGDDPFSGRRDGTVVSRNGTSVAVETTHGVFLYDHRQLRPLD